jgi:hypothetical protein
MAFLFAQKMLSQAISYPDKSDSSIVRIERFYINKGKIFSDDYKLLQLSLPDYFKGCKLNEADILKSESILLENFPNKSRMNRNIRFYKNHWRQYLGYIDNNGNILVFIHLERYHSKISEVSYEYWGKNISIVLEEWNKHNTDDYIIDLSRQSIKRYGSY